MMYVVVVHLSNWWLSYDDLWFSYLFIYIFDFFGAAGFLFVSGISIALSYNKRNAKAQTSNDYTKKMHRKEYFLRAFFILIVSILFNFMIALFYNGDLTEIWHWYVLLTIALSQILAWPLLKTSKLFRIIFGISLWIFNIYFLEFLLPHEGETNFYGILFYIFYRDLRDDPLISFFTFFLIGSVFGELIFEIIQIEDKNERLSILKKKMLIPSLIVVPILITIGVLFKFPEFITTRGSLSMSLYMLGLEIILLTILLSFEEFELIHTEKSYRFLYYFSYYSLSVFIFHNPLALLFYHQLSLEYIWFFIIPSVILAGLLLRFLHNKIEGKYSILGWKITFSIKVLVSRMSQNIVRKRANRK